MLLDVLVKCMIEVCEMVSALCDGQYLTFLHINFYALCIVPFLQGREVPLYGHMGAFSISLSASFS